MFLYPEKVVRKMQHSSVACFDVHLVNHLNRYTITMLFQLLKTWFGTDPNNEGGVIVFWCRRAQCHTLVSSARNAYFQHDPTNMRQNHSLTPYIYSPIGPVWAASYWPTVGHPHLSGIRRSFCVACAWLGSLTRRWATPAPSKSA